MTAPGAHAASHPSSPFAWPVGLRGRLAGWLMLHLNQQGDLLPLLDVRPGSTVLEVGYGPGGLLRMLAERTEAARIIGVDPSETMRAVALRRNRSAARRLDLQVGTAAATGLPAASVDLVVSVNNVGIWPDLGAAIVELHRVLRPGGRIVIATHGGTRPSRIARGLRLTPACLNRIQRTMAARFVDVRRCRLAQLDVFLGTVPEPTR